MHCQNTTFYSYIDVLYRLPNLIGRLLGMKYKEKYKFCFHRQVQEINISTQLFVLHRSESPSLSQCLLLKNQARSETTYQCVYGNIVK